MTISSFNARGSHATCDINSHSRRLWIVRGLTLVLGLLVFGGCEAGQPSIPTFVGENSSAASVKTEETRMWMTVGDRRFAITLFDNAAARALAVQLPLTLDTSELNGNEKYVDLPKALPADAIRPGTIHAGDLMLYGTHTLVLFYETFHSSYGYTRLGRVDDPSELAHVLGRGMAHIAFSTE